MATFTIAFSGSGVFNGSKSWTISDADEQKLIDFLVTKYAGQSTPTSSQALSSWTQEFVNQTIADVRAYQKSQAVAAPIVFT